jgi:hypothetical protein
VAEGRKYKELLQLYSKATGMEINIHESTIIFNNIEEVFRDFFPYKVLEVQDGSKYLGLTIKPNDYGMGD